MLREVFNSFDPRLAKLQEFLDSGGASKTNARLAESCFAWTLTMLGFRVFHLGGVEQTQHAADDEVAPSIETAERQGVLVMC